jgi:hypothetical protein
LVEAAHGIFIRSPTYLRCAVDEVIGEQDLKEIKVAATLDLFVAASDQHFGGIIPSGVHEFSCLRLTGLATIIAASPEK